MARKGYKPQNKNALIAVRVTDEIDEFLTEMSLKNKCKKSDLVRSMIEHCKTLAARDCLGFGGN